MSIEEAAARAERAIVAHEQARQEYEMASRAYADGLRVEQQMEAQRPGVKDEAVRRLMATVNPASLNGKQHSASSAEAIVETDETYASYLLNQRNIVHAKNRAYTQAKSAELRARTASLSAKLHIALVKSLAGVN